MACRRRQQRGGVASQVVLWRLVQPQLAWQAAGAAGPGRSGQGWAARCKAGGGLQLCTRARNWCQYAVPLTLCNAPDRHCIGALQEFRSAP